MPEKLMVIEPHGAGSTPPHSTAVYGSTTVGSAAAAAQDDRRAMEQHYRGAAPGGGGGVPSPSNRHGSDGEDLSPRSSPSGETPALQSDVFFCCKMMKKCFCLLKTNEGQ